MELEGESVVAEMRCPGIGLDASLVVSSSSLESRRARRGRLRLENSLLVGRSAFVRLGNEESADMLLFSSMMADVVGRPLP